LLDTIVSELSSSFKWAWLVAHNAGIVLGGRPMRPDVVDWRWAGALLLGSEVQWNRIHA
jgi:2-keto-4-pentenoate hydratase